MIVTKKQKKEIGKRIKQVREEILERTQVEMTKVLKIKQAMISNIERGDRLPSVEVLLILNKESDKSIDWILKGNT
ncbi:helix-turn-helix domain-containing protein [Thermodesulfobacteriota bacterium]